MAKVFQVNTASGGSLLTNLVVYYKLEDATEFYVGGGTYDLTNTGGVTFSPAKVNNGADHGTYNTTKYLRINNDLGITGGAISMASWIKLAAETTSGQSPCFFGQGDGGTFVGFTIYYNYNGGARQLTFTRVRTGTATVDCPYTVNLGTTFHHIAGTYDGSNLRLYFDGSLVAGPIAASGSGSGGQSDFFSTMAYAEGGYYGGEGFVDELGVWSRALSTNEITDLYNGGSGQTMIDSVSASPSFLLNFV